MSSLLLALLTAVFVSCSSSSSSSSRIDELQLHFSSYDVILYGATSNLAAKYLFQSLFHLSAELRGGLNIHAVGREDIDTWGPRLSSIIAANTTCGRPASPMCGALRDEFVRGSGVVFPATTRNLTALGMALNASRTSRPGWAGRVIYFAIASELVPEALRDLARVIDIRDNTRVVVEKPVGSDRASAKNILSALRELLSPLSPPLLVDHFLAKAGVRLAASVRHALAAYRPSWQEALSAPELTEAFAIEPENLHGRASYFNTAGAARDMLLTHLTLAAAAALQSTSSRELTAAARAGVLGGLRVARSPASGRPLVTAGMYVGGIEHGLEHSGRVTAVGVVLESRGTRVVMATGKSLGFKSTAIRQTLSIATGPGRVGAAAETAAREICGPLTLTFHIQGEVIAPSVALAPIIRSLGLPVGPPALLITGLCGAVLNTLGDPRVPIQRALPTNSRFTANTFRSRWEVRENTEAGVFAASLDARGLRIDDALVNAGKPITAAAAHKRLEEIGDTPAITGGDAYTACLASALVGATESFLSMEETDRLWAIWEEAIVHLDGSVEKGEIREYTAEQPPPWLAPHEAGMTMHHAVGVNAEEEARRTREVEEF
jgi:glucose-6-phosphate 1-dehydrogenase